LIGSFEKPTGPAIEPYTVAAQDLLITVTEDGNVESASNVDVKCLVLGGSSILWIVPDGSEVKKGDKVVELEASVIEDQINAQRITYEKARSAMIQAEKDLEVAKISVKEYLEGTFMKSVQDADTQITIAEENLRSATNSHEYTKRMFQRGYVSKLELESQDFAVKRASLELDSAKTAKRVLEEFTKVKTLEDLTSKVATAEAKVESEKAAYQLEEAKLKRLQDQLKNCVIYSPADGMVVFANEQSRGRFGGQNQQGQVEEGAAVRERQSLLKIPDLSRMQVRVNVHETKVEDIRPGMRARINIQGRELQGEVTQVANQPEPNSWFSGSVKEYATIVKVDGNPKGLKPGMTAEVEILVAHLKNVLTLPVAAVVELRGQFFCWVVGPDGTIERRQLELGLNNEKYVEVKSGISEGDKVVWNPRREIEEAKGKATEQTSEEVNVTEKFGDSKNSANGTSGPASSGPGQEPGEFPRNRGPNDQSGGPGRGGPGDATGSGGPGGSRGMGGPRAGGGMDPSQFDTNKDGKVSKEEAPEMMQRFFDRIDTNGDGMLDQDEIRAMRNRGGGPGGRGGSRGGNLMQFDKDGDGKVSREEAPEPMQNFFGNMDTNSDGFIDQEELKQIQGRFGGGPGGAGGPGGPDGGGPGGPRGEGADRN
jgi:RND family efflux transporter MFP subunit